MTLSLPSEPDWRLDYAGIREQLEDAAPTSEGIAAIVTAIRRKKLPDPNLIGNAGSFFKNPIVDVQLGKQLQKQFPLMPAYPEDEDYLKLSAAWLIEHADLKGYRDGDAGVSEQHALVLVNYDQARGADILKTAAHVQQTVMKKYGIQLDPEPTIVG